MSCTIKESLWVVLLLVVATGVLPRAVLRPTRGARTSAVASSPKSLRATRLKCVRFGAFNTLTIFFCPRSGQFFIMALYYELPVYRDTYQLILKIFSYTKDFSKEYKYTLGQDMKRDAMQLVRSIYRANISTQK